MVTAGRSDKNLIIDILSNSFEDNQSVNYIVKQDSRRKQRIRALMAYSFEICYTFGEVYLTNDKTGCALVLYPDKKKFSLLSTWLDIQLVFNVIGLSRVGKAMSRESIIKSNYPKESIYYLWFLGVINSNQNKGIGTQLLKEVIEDSQSQQRPVYLETSTLKNIPWYEKNGFKIYNELNFGYKLFMLKRDREIPIL